MIKTSTTVTMNRAHPLFMLILSIDGGLRSQGAQVGGLEQRDRIPLAKQVLGTLDDRRRELRRLAPEGLPTQRRRPAMMVLPAPGSTASRKCRGWRESISSYTAEI